MEDQNLGMATHRLFPALGPMLLISMGYIDPGKWSAVVEGGARFGHDLLFLIFLFSSAAILCQYLAARIAVITQKNLAQICSEEYNRCTCIFLAIQAEVSLIVLDLTMILGIAHGLNLLFGLNLSICLLFTATDIVLFPLFTSLLVKHKAEVIFVSIAGFVLASYIFGVLISRPEIPVVLTGPRLSGESLFALMSLLGANIMPHNFYVHSSIIQKQKGTANISKGALCHDHFFAILSIYSFIYLVNCAVMNSAATVFHSAGLLALTFQDIFLLLDQVLRNPIALFALFFIMFVSSHITSLTWNFDGQVVLHELLRIDPPIWVHRATIRMFVIFVSLYSTWNSGAEQIFQLLVFTQVILAMLLPSSFIPLFRVASSKTIMGDYKISQLVEFLALITLLGMLVLNIIFVIEMLFGHSDWVGDFWWNMGSSMSLPYIVLLTTAFASLIFMLWLAATPLKSATVKADSQWNCELPREEAEYYAEETNEASDSGFPGEGFTTAEQPLEKFVDTRLDYSDVESVFDLPESLQRSEQVLELPPADENFAGQAASKSHQEAIPPIDFVPDGMVDKDVAESVLPDDDTSEGNEFLVPVGKTVEIDAESTIEKDEDHVNVWEPEESYREASGPTSTSEGPGSFRSLSGKSDESGNGPGSLSRLSGLGRAARRQLAAILDEFWGQLYDFHGQATREAKLKQLDILFGIDPKSITPQKTNLVATSSGHFPSGTERGAALPFTAKMYDSSKQQRMVSSIDSPYGFQTGSTPWTSDLPYMEGYVPKSSCSVQDSGERRYSSLRLPPSSESWDYQPATVHGYQFSSYLSRITTDRSSDPLNTLLDSPTAKSPSYISASYRDPLPYVYGQNSQSLVNSLNTSTMYSPVMSRNSRLQADKPYYDPSSYGSGENVGSPGSTKKYHSLPDISGLAVPRRDSNLNDRISKWNAPPGFGPSVSKAVHERSLYSSTGSRAGVPLAYDDLSSSKMYREAYTTQSSLNSDTKSLWSKQPFEQLFGVAGTYDGLGDEVGSKPNAVIPRSTSRVDSETELLKSFRHCIMKLLKLEGCDWLFKQNGGADEDLIDRVAASEKLHSEAELRDLNKVGQVGDFQFFSSDRKYASASKIQNADVAKFLVSSVSYCGDGCIWQVDLVVSFGVWCIHRILELSLMESRPELWGKYTYVLNRLQGILDPAFSKPRTPMVPCLCIEMAGRKSSPPAAAANGGQLPPTAKPGKGIITTASTVLEMIKDVEIAVSCRKGRTGTAAGDVAFPKGKENLASVLKRYKRRLALYNNKPLK